MPGLDPAGLDDRDAGLVKVSADGGRLPGGLTAAARMPGPSKRTSLRASVLETYSAPLTGLTTMLNRTVPTPEKEATSSGGSAMASISKTSRSGRSRNTKSRQSRPSSSSQAPVSSSYFAISPTSGPGMPSTFAFGAGSPPGATPTTVSQGATSEPPSQTASAGMPVVRFPERNTAA